MRITESSEHFPIRARKKKNKWSRVITLSEDASNLFGQLSLLSRGTSLLAKKVKAQPKLFLETAAQKYDRESSMMRNCAIQCLLCAHELATNTQRRTDGASPASRPRNPIQATYKRIWMRNWFNLEMSLRPDQTGWCQSERSRHRLCESGLTEWFRRLKFEHVL